MPLLNSADLERRIVRYAALIPCLNAFIDCRTPGSEAKENFTIIGPGVSENPAQHVHLTEPHGFNIGGARQPPGCVNSQHSHKTAEVFVVHSGDWRFDLGEHGDAAQVELHSGDVISLPVDMFRGFTSIGPAADGSPGFLWAVLGSDNPGRVTWAPRVFELAREYGLTLLEGGRLIDSAAGEGIPSGETAMPPTARDDADALWQPTPTEAGRLVWRAGTSTAPSLRVVGEGGALDWTHGFTLDRIEISMTNHVRQRATSPTVIFVHRGVVSVEIDRQIGGLGEGDTVTIPIGSEYELSALGTAVAYVVTG